MQTSWLQSRKGEICCSFSEDRENSIKNDGPTFFKKLFCQNEKHFSQIHVELVKLVEVHNTGVIDKLSQTFYIFIHFRMLSAKLKLSPTAKHCAFNLGQNNNKSNLLTCFQRWGCYLKKKSYYFCVECCYAETGEIREWL